MLLSHRKRFIFTKTVKTAGTSVESYFEKWCMPEGEWEQLHGREEHVSEAGIIGERSANPSGARWYNHMSAANIKSQLPAKIWNDYFKFTVVRNPFDKLISGFFMFDNFQNGSATNIPPIERFRTWIKAFHRLVSENRQLADSETIPHFLKPLELSMIDRNKYLIDGKECVDFFIRFEHLAEDIAHVCKKTDIPFERDKIPVFKKGLRSQETPIQAYYDTQCQDLAQDLYAWEIARFGYSLPTQ